MLLQPGLISGNMLSSAKTLEKLSEQSYNTDVGVLSDIAVKPLDT